MKEKEIRAKQLDQLKDASPYAVQYIVERLNAAFKPFQAFCFESMEEANKVYEHFCAVDFPAYVRKYAKVSF